MLEKIKFNYEVSDNQSNLFSMQHKRYECKISYNGKYYKFEYQCNPKYTMPNKNDCLESLSLDADIYAYNTLESFMAEFGYNDIKEAKKIYGKCKKTCVALYKMFTDEELETLRREIEA